MTAIAVAALMAVAGVSLPAYAPKPADEALQRLAATAPKPASQISAVDQRCLALNVYWEARGEPEEGMAAVAHVTLNRVGSDGFPATLCGVVRQGGSEWPCQFHWYCDGRPDNPSDDDAWTAAQAIAFRVLAGQDADPTGGALYFHNRQLNPSWAQARVGQKVIGRHVFFRLKNGDPGERQVAQTTGFVDP